MCIRDTHDMYDTYINAHCFAHKWCEYKLIRSLLVTGNAYNKEICTCGAKQVCDSIFLFNQSHCQLVSGVHIYVLFENNFHLDVS